MADRVHTGGCLCGGRRHGPALVPLLYAIADDLPRFAGSAEGALDGGDVA